VNPDCPVHKISVGGLVFVRFSEEVSGYGGDTKRNKINGHVGRVSEETRKNVLAKIGNKVIRSTAGKKARSWVVDKLVRGYRPFERDQPAADFIYMEIMEDRESPYEVPTRKTLGEELAPKTTKSKK
tara:strand:- start:301 stop:681 length:381 start_codon:yes stop_codon:yes gene_type:complete